MVTVDCGVGSDDEVSLASTLGIDTVITDHHAIGENLPPAAAVVNPSRSDSFYPHATLTGVGIALKLAQALYGALGLPVPDRLFGAGRAGHCRGRRATHRREPVHRQDRTRTHQPHRPPGTEGDHREGRTDAGRPRRGVAVVQDHPQAERSGAAGERRGEPAAAHGRQPAGGGAAGGRAGAPGTTRGGCCPARPSTRPWRRSGRSPRRRRPCWWSRATSGGPASSAWSPTTSRSATTGRPWR